MSIKYTEDISFKVIIKKGYYIVEVIKNNIRLITSECDNYLNEIEFLKTLLN